MSQYLSQVPRHLLQQQQRLTPQQIQSLNILQLDLLSLESRIEQELEDNPALERVSSEEVVEAPEPAAAETEPGPEARSEAETPLVVSDRGEDFARLERLVEDYGWNDEEYESRGRLSASALSEAGDLKMEAMANTPSRPASLQEYLLGQWSLAEVDPRTRAIGERIIEHVEDNGRLETPLEEIARKLDPPATLPEMEAALARVQELDPPGIAARTLQECLLLQLRALPGENSLEKRIVQEQFENLQKNRLPRIARKLRVSMDELKAAIDVISGLSLHPGEQIVAREPPAIIPDVLVEFDEARNEYVVSLSRGNTRELRLSREFREALENARDEGTRAFLRQKLESAKSIIDAVRFRRERLLEVSRAIVAAQRDFLDRGEQHLRALRMSDLAAELGCDPSTISRAVDQKYIQTPRGVFPLRMFFTGGTDTGNGQALSWDSVKAKVKQIVDGEDRHRPLSDDQIVERLMAEGIEIKRRTVAKYRQQLDIPSARHRRQY